jgi:hypothetical protein
MREPLQRRIRELQKELAVGQARLYDLDRQEVALRETVLRISGAIQVLEELLAGLSPFSGNETRPLSGQPVLTKRDPVAEVDATNLPAGDGGPRVAPVDEG